MLQVPPELELQALPVPLVPPELERPELVPDRALKAVLTPVRRDLLVVSVLGCCLVP